MEINGNWVGRNLHDEIPGLNPPAWPQLIQRRGESAEPRKHVLGDRGVHVVDTMAYAQLQKSKSGFDTQTMDWPLRSPSVRREARYTLSQSETFLVLFFPFPISSAR